MGLVMERFDVVRSQMRGFPEYHVRVQRDAGHHEPPFITRQAPNCPIRVPIHHKAAPGREIENHNMWQLTARLQMPLLGPR